MPTFEVTRTEVKDFRHEDGSPMNIKAMVLHYEIPDATHLTGHAHIIPFAAVGSYQLENGGGTFTEAVDFFIRERMQSGYEANNLPVPAARARAMVSVGAADRAMAVRDRLEVLNAYVEDLAALEAEQSLPCGKNKLIANVTAGLMTEEAPGPTRENLTQVRGWFRAVCEESLIGFEVDKGATGWADLEAIAQSSADEMPSERARQVEQRWGDSIMRTAWKVHREQEGQGS